MFPRTRKAIKSHLENRHYVRLSILMLIITSIVIVVLPFYICAATAAFIFYSLLTVYCKKCKKITDNEAREYMYEMVKTFADPITKALKIKPVVINIDKIPWRDGFALGTGKRIRTLGMYGGRNGIINTLQTKPEITLFYGNIAKSSRYSKSIFIFQTVMVLAHEFRHAYQDQNNIFDVQKYITPDKNHALYKKQPVEVDADRFGFKFVMKNILKILSLIFNKK